VIQTKIWLNFLATVNIIIFSSIWIWAIINDEFLAILPTRYYHYIFLISSLLIYIGRIGGATVLQSLGCFIHGITAFMQIGIGMAFSSQNFWEYLVYSPFTTLELFSFLGYMVVAAGLLIIEYLRYNAKKNPEPIS
jgi:hypothetical protein